VPPNFITTVSPPEPTPGVLACGPFVASVATIDEDRARPRVTPGKAGQLQIALL